MKTRFVACALLMLMTCDWTFGQQQPPAPPARESHKGRVIFSIVGGAAGFVAGVFTGLFLFDDAINSERKVTAMAIGFGAAEAVGGYFLGRSLDKRNTATTTLLLPTDQQLNMATPANTAILRVTSRLRAVDSNLPAAPLR